jgi:hypothetical protein
MCCKMPASVSSTSIHKAATLRQRTQRAPLPTCSPTLDPSSVLVLCHFIQTASSDRPWLHEQHLRSRSPRLVSPSHTLSSPSNKPLNIPAVDAANCTFVTRPTGCAPTSHILPTLPPAHWVLACVWCRHMGVFHWGRAERGWHRDMRVSLFSTRHVRELTCVFMRALLTPCTGGRTLRLSH